MIRLRAIARVAGCLMAAASLPSMAAAASFTVTPTQVFLTSKAPTAPLTIRNESDATIRFALSVFQWDQGAAGDTLLLPTADIVLVSTLVSLGPREERKLQIATSAAFGPVEKTYRVIVEELPPPGTGDETSSSVSMRTKMGIPVFVRPDAAVVWGDGAVTSVTVERGRAIVRVENTGAAHFSVDSVRVTGATRPGSVVFNKVVNGWYVLAGRVQSYDMPLTAAECESAVSLTVDVKIGETMSHGRADRPADGCRPVADQ